MRTVFWLTPPLPAFSELVILAKKKQPLLFRKRNEFETNVNQIPNIVYGIYLTLYARSYESLMANKILVPFSGWQASSLWLFGGDFPCEVLFYFSNAHVRTFISTI